MQTRYADKIVLDGKYVSLEPIDHSHLEEVLDICQPTEIWTYMPYRLISKKDVSDWIEKAIDRNDQGLDLRFCIRNTMTGQIVGSTRYLDISETFIFIISKKVNQNKIVEIWDFLK